MIAVCNDGKTVLKYDDFHKTDANDWPIWQVVREYELNRGES